MPSTITLTPESESIQYLCKRDKRLARVISLVGTISYKPYEDGYAFLVHEIIEQMLSIKAGAKIYARLEDLCSGIITVTAINSLSDEQIRSIGTSAAKVSYIRALTNAIVSDAINLSELPRLDDKEIIKTLTSVKGIGNWTAKMYLIFVHHFTTFHKKNIVQGFLVYNEFAENITKESDPVRQKQSL